LPVLAEHRAAGFLTLRDSLLGKLRHDWPRTAGLDAALREALEGKTETRATVYPAELFDRLVHYRNTALGHGAAGQRRADFYEHIGTSLLLAAGEFLARLDILAGRSLLFLPDIRQVQGQWLVERFELVGEAARRLESWTLPRAAATVLPDAAAVYLARPGEASVSNLVRLHPLVVYDAEANECALLNSRRGKTRTEYLCYTTGQTTLRPDLGSEQRHLLARALGMAEVSEEQARVWAEKSTAEEGWEPAPLVGPRCLGEYELLSELGRGGMGIVYRAWQPSLGRQVALKCLAQSGDAKAEARFQREIRALGRVDHPHVVKVFASGSDGTQWFYVMELVDGVPLAAVCDKLVTSVQSVTDLDVPTWQTALAGACAEARTQEKPLSGVGPNQAGQPPLSPSAVQVIETPTKQPNHKDYVARVVGLMRQVAEAAHALHERGIIHRDIKPGNIMVSPDGTRATLMDLGLAQLADDVEGRLTRTRQFVGTLRYASPQQVLAVAQLDGRSDIYSLGATLWELLALRPLFGATEQTPTPELMEKIQREEPARLRLLHPGLSRNLEAVVHKCLEKSPDQRYATAHDLAEDLRRVQDGEPVQARPVGRLDRTLKWARRHPAPAAALALLLTTVAALAMGFVLVQHEWSRAERANADLTDANHRLLDEQGRTAKANADLSEANLRLAAEKGRTRKALDKMTSEVLDDLLARQKVLTPQQKTFLTDALAEYEDLARETGADEQTRAGVAAAYLRVGNIRRRLGQTQDAGSAYRRSQQCYARLVMDFPGVHAYRCGLADVHNELGNLWSHTGLWRPAKQEIRAALEGYKQLAAEFPTVAQYRIDLAGSHMNLGNLLDETGHPQDAEQEYRAGLVMQQQLAKDFPTVPKYRGDLAMTHNNLGNLLSELGRGRDAEQEFRAAVAIYQQLAKEFPTEPEYQSNLALCHNNLGILLSNINQERAAEQEHRTALAIYQKLAADFPAVPEYQSDLARSHFNLGSVLHGARRPREAEQEYRAALAIFKQLADNFPTVTSYPEALAAGHNHLGALLDDMGRRPEAEQEQRAALAIKQKMAAEFPAVPRYQSDVADSHQNLGTLLYHLGRQREAEQEGRAALALYRKLAQHFPTVPKYQNDIAMALGNLALISHAHKDYAAARRLLEEALPYHQSALKAEPRNVTYRSSFRDNITALAGVLAKLGQHREAVALVDQLLRLAALWPVDRYDVSCILAQCASLVQNDAKLSPAERQQLARSYADRAMVALQKAVAAGYRDVKHLKEDHDLDSLRTRDDFRKLLTGLQNKAPAATSSGGAGK